MTEAAVARIAPEDLPGGLEALVHLHAVVWPDESDPYGGAFGQTFDRHRARDGFRLVAVTRPGELVGYAYAYVGERGQWWTDWVVTHAPAPIEAMIGGHLEVVEIAVSPTHRRLGIGRRLLRALLSDAKEPIALLSTEQGNMAARSLYESEGWQELVSDLDGGYSLFGYQLIPQG